MKKLIFLALVSISFASCATTPERKIYVDCETFVPVSCGTIEYIWNKDKGFYDRIKRPCYERVECIEIKGE